MFKDKSILITGGTGSFGYACVRYLLDHTDVSRLVVFSRDEMKQYNMMNDFNNDARLRFFIGDVRDLERLRMAVRGVDIVIHAAANKIVPLAEVNPIECVKTNIWGAQNIITAAIEEDVDQVVALSTDKASSPINLYGATKLVSDKLFTAAHVYSKPGGTKFSVVRYGNVMGSRGSVIPFFYSIRHKGSMPITDLDMTRFMISLDQGVALVMTAINDMLGGELYVKKIPSMKVTDIARAISPKAEFDVVGIRPGEKIHEQMISKEEAATTFEYEGHFKILPSIFSKDEISARKGEGRKVKEDFSYSSDDNSHWMTHEELIAWMTSNGFSFD